MPILSLRLWEQVDGVGVVADNTVAEGAARWLSSVLLRAAGAVVAGGGCCGQWHATRSVGRHGALTYVAGGEAALNCTTLEHIIELTGSHISGSVLSHVSWR